MILIGLRAEKTDAGLYSLRFYARISFEKMIQSEILVEFVIKIVETRYPSKSKNKAFTTFKRSTNHSGLKVSLKPFTFFKNAFIQMSKAFVCL